MSVELDERTYVDTATGVSTIHFYSGEVIRATFAYTKATGHVTLSAGNASVLTLSEMEKRVLALQAWRKKNKMLPEIGWHDGGCREMSITLETKNNKTTVVMKVENHAVLDLSYDRVTLEASVANRPERTLHADEFDEWLDHFSQWIVWCKRAVAG